MLEKVLKIWFFFNLLRLFWNIFLLSEKPAEKSQFIFFKIFLSFCVFSFLFSFFSMQKKHIGIYVQIIKEKIYPHFNLRHPKAFIINMNFYMRQNIKIWRTAGEKSHTTTTFHQPVFAERHAKYNASKNFTTFKIK